MVAIETQSLGQIIKDDSIGRCLMEMTLIALLVILKCINNNNYSALSGG